MPDKNNILPPKTLMELYPWLIRKAEERKIPRVIAEELANDTLFVASESFDPNLGSLKGYCAKVLLNKIINYVKANRPVTETFDDEFFSDMSDPENILMDKEKIIQTKQFISLLLSKLDVIERRFLMKYQETLDELQKRAVGETARRLGLQETEGTAIIKRICRKAKQLRSVEKEEIMIHPQEIDMNKQDKADAIVFNKNNRPSEHEDGLLASCRPSRLYKSIEMSDSDDIYFQIVAIEHELTSLSFDNFWANITDEQKQKLASFS